jgi:hypothetical protein
MKKHIQKKCLFEVDMPDNTLELLGGKGISTSTPLKANDVPKNFNAISITEDNKALMCFPFNESGRLLYIPEPNPILIYFDSAYSHFKAITERRKTLLNHFKGVKMDEDYLNDLYGFYGSVNGFIILLFTAIEAFINHNIPEEYKYVVQSDRKTEIYNKNQIMLLPFKEKMGPILKEIFKKDFGHSYKLKYQHIINLKEMRDNIVHLKPEKGTNTPYAYLFKKGLTFKFESTIDAVMDFINFYKPGYITYCKCSKDF